MVTEEGGRKDDCGLRGVRRVEIVGCR